MSEHANRQRTLAKAEEARARASDLYEAQVFAFDLRQLLRNNSRDLEATHSANDSLPFWLWSTIGLLILMAWGVVAVSWKYPQLLCE